MGERITGVGRGCHRQAAANAKESRSDLTAPVRVGFQESRGEHDRDVLAPGLGIVTRSAETP